MTVLVVLFKWGGVFIDESISAHLLGAEVALITETISAHLLGLDWAP